jgi:hypothetical protein
MPDGEKDAPSPGDLCFCLMCCEPSQFDENMNMIKFYLNSIKDIVERIRIKQIKMKMELFWDQHPNKDGRREKFLKERDLRKRKDD